jgi:hypothetical protein
MTGDEMTGDEMYEGTKLPGRNDRVQNERGQSVMPPLILYIKLLHMFYVTPLLVHFLNCQVKLSLFHS